jgi:hypothetical protein
MPATQPQSSSVPIPQGAVLEPLSGTPNVAGDVPIPPGATLEPLQQQPQPSAQPADSGEDFKSQAWSSAGHDLMHGNLSKAASDAGNLFTSKNPAAVEALKQTGEGAIGAAKSAGQTLSTIGDIATLGTTHLLPGSENAGKSLQIHGDNEQGGAMAEQVGEFALGEGVFKALSELPLVERLAQTSKIVNLAKKYPALARIIHAGVRGATVGGTVGGIHGGAEGAVEGAALGGVGEAGISTLQNAKALTIPFRENAAQPELQSGIRKVAGNVADQAGVARPQNPSMYKTVEEAADNVLAKSKGQYKQLDQASGGRWQRFDDQLRNIRQKMSEVAGIDDDQYSTLEDRQNEIETLQANLIDELKSSGKIDPKLADQAVGNYRQAQSLYDLDAALQRSTSGKPVGVGKTTGLPETVDPKKLAPRVNALWKSGRLQQAVGEANASDLIDYVSDAAKHQQNAVRLKLLLKVIGIGGASAGAIGTATHIFSGGRVTPIE